jgi:acylphosphatase
VDAPYGDTLSYTAKLASGADAALAGWPSTLPPETFSGTPANGDVGTIDVVVTATDKAGEEITDTFKVTVLNTNDAPTLANAIADQQATEDDEFEFKVPASTFADVDVGDKLTWTATLADGSALPSWLKFDAKEREFSGTPRNADVGTLQIMLTATDEAGEAVSDVFGADGGQHQRCADAGQPDRRPDRDRGSGLHLHGARQRVQRRGRAVWRHPGLLRPARQRRCAAGVAEVRRCHAHLLRHAGQRGRRLVRSAR